jgi:hypothetical protein
VIMVWVLHIGGLRRSPTLGRIEDRFPKLASLLNILSLDSWEKAGALPPPPDLRRILQLLALIGVMAVLWLAFYLLNQLFMQWS